MRGSDLAACVLKLAALGSMLPLPTAGQPAKPPEIVCELATALAGRMDGRTLLTDGLVTGRDRMRLTFAGHDAKAGTATMRIDDSATANPVSMTVEAGAIVYLQEEPGIGNLLISTANKPTPDGWPAVLSQHGYEGGTLTVRVMVGACRARAAP